MMTTASPLRMLQARGYRGLMAEVPAQAHDHDVLAFIMQGVQQARRRVAAAVVHQQQLKRHAHLAQDRAKAIPEPRDVLLLVIERNHDAQEGLCRVGSRRSKVRRRIHFDILVVGPSVHAGARPLQRFPDTDGRPIDRIPL